MKTQRAISAAVPMAAALFAGASAHALSLDITYSTAVQGNANFAAIQSDVLKVENEFSSLYSDPITLRFTIDQASGVLGESLFSGAYFRGSYDTLRTALVNDAKSADDAIAVANLPATAPIGPGANQWYVTSANAKALGLLDAKNAASDGTYTFGSDAGLFDFNSSDGITAGEYDFQSVTEHEFSELMGRTSQLTNPGFGYDAFDLFRYTSAGVHNFGPSGAGVYFSIDKGATNLKNYNGVAGADVQDWASGDPTDSFNAFGTPGQVGSLSAVDKEALDVFGYDRIAGVPEPKAWALMLVGFAAMGATLRSRRRQTYIQAA